MDSCKLADIGVCWIWTSSKTEVEVIHYENLVDLSSIVTKHKTTHAGDERKQNRHSPYGHAISDTISFRDIKTK